MISQKEMLGIIATEAIESDSEQNPNGIRLDSPEKASIKYSLRLVREKDGALRWDDD
ncbi:MAG: hypothetical protein KGL39_39750 [Patescibacteria group bacterium]|nr:hypothetical protein [Patescibacteria group bacterium]